MVTLLEESFDVVDGSYEDIVSQNSFTIDHFQKAVYFPKFKSIFHSQMMEMKIGLSINEIINHDNFKIIIYFD